MRIDDDDDYTGDRMAAVLGLAMEVAINKEGTGMGTVGQGSFEVCYSMENLLSLNHWKSMTGFALTSVGVSP